MGLSKVMEATKGQQAQMAGSMTGFGTAVQIGYEQFEAGMRGSNAATNELALYTKLTGGNSKKMMKSMTRLTRGMHLSDMQQTRLSSSIQGLSQNFGMTAEELMDSLAGLGKEMDNFKLMGVGAEMTEAGLAITAALGQEAGNMGNELLASIMSAEGIFSAQALGIGEERKLMMNKETATTANAMRLIEKAGEAASRKYNDAIAGGMDKAQAVAMITETYGKGIAQAAQVYMQLKDRADELNTSVGALLQGVTDAKDADKRFLDTWDNFKNQILSPLTEAIYGLTEKLMSFVVENKPLLIKIGRGLLVLSGLMAARGAISGAAKAINYAGLGAPKYVAGKAAQGGMGLLKGLGKLSKALFTGFKMAIPFLGKALFAALSAIPVLGWIAAGIGLLIYIFRDEIGAALKGVWEAVKPIAIVVMEGLQKVWTMVSAHLLKIWDNLKYIGGVIVNVGKLFWQAVTWLGKAIWNKIGPIVKGIWSAIKMVVSGIWDALGWVWDQMKNFFEWIFSPLTGLLDALRSSWIGRKLFGDGSEDKETPNGPVATEQSRANMAAVTIDNSRIIELEQQLARTDRDLLMADNMDEMRVVMAQQADIQRQVKEEIERLREVTETQTGLTAEGNDDRRSQGARPTQQAAAGVGDR